MQKVAINICDCEVEHENFSTSVYRFSEIGEVELPDLCPNSDLTQNELTQFDLLIETREENKNSTLYSVYMGRIARIQEDLYFYTFGDIDEIGESNFYISGSLREVVEYLLSEWGELAPDWRGLFKKWTTDGIPAGYDSSSLRSWTGIFLNPDPEIVNDLEGLEVALYLDIEDEELVSELKKL
jgi:hypothetical protein